nr:16S rRNA (uracil(1498)-N(3))-methyltransferase [Bacteroidota bacterium]
GDDYVLNEEESKHCIRVLRKNVGDTIQLIDGKGGFYTAEVVDAHPKRTALKVLEKKENFEKRDYYLHIAIGPTKNNSRIEWFLEKATEIGIDEISFLECQNSERAVIKVDRLEKIVTSAVKQSIKAYHPTLHKLMVFNAFIKEQSAFEGKKLIAHCRDGEKEILWKSFAAKEKVLILIGPEGDFTAEEVNLALEAGFSPISLGSQRFRTETAAIVACHTISLANSI